MRLSDVMSHAGLAGYAEMAMILFMLAFIAIVIATFRPSTKSAMDAASRLPFEDDPAAQREEDIRS
jgi:cbb3-type cytochrome oxidase subunit 3